MIRKKQQEGEKNKGERGGRGVRASGRESGREGRAELVYKDLRVDDA